MGHPKREDEPGSWHHLMNRGVGQRTLFDGDEDTRGFLALVAKVARLGLLEPVAFCLLPNHFHLLAVSPEGRLGEAMQLLEGIYGRGFNRRRGRDGGLVKARYRSKPVRSDTYRRALIGYIDQNPVDAKLVVDPCDYPYGSARHYARPSGPPWLSRGRLEGFACQLSGLPTFGPEAYAGAFGGPSGVARNRWLAAVMADHRRDDVSLDELLAASPEHIRRWLDERSMLADGMKRVIPAADAESVAAVVTESSTPAWAISPRGKRRPFWTILAAGLLHEIAGQTRRQISVRLSIPECTCRNLCAEHRGLLRSDPAYAAIAAGLVRSAIDRCHGLRNRPQRV